MVPEPTFVRDATEELNTMLPFPDSLRRGYVSWHRWYAESKLILINFE
jgi:hypothetical protein